ncbi:hypothetical protein BDQ12DRAFT_675951 [Crucibulum laeve]|uniref:Uncharacterized protein n=1 Tax=Crucibulum laeve TaxID=68775 RepID=A0A5C3MBK8_9AGAR|nr:hypothetical protein BDQ12DRAFT_675951 [Crucibulum laeve]
MMRAYFLFHNRHITENYINENGSSQLSPLSPPPPATTASGTALGSCSPRRPHSRPTAAMPSLRRTASSPSVRSSPYSSSSSASVATRGHGHRRSSGSETTGRRVLADIEWWRVTDGQCDPSAADRDDQDLVADDALAIAVASATSPDLGLEQLHAPSPWITSTTVGSSEVCVASTTYEIVPGSIPG